MQHNGPWANINLRWRVTNSQEGQRLSEVFCALVEEAKAAWDAEHPEINDKVIVYLSDEIVELQERHPWMRMGVGVDNEDVNDVATWYRTARDLMQTVLTATERDIAGPVIERRHLAAQENEYINNYGNMSNVTAAMDAQREVDKAHSFVYHAMCKTGVLLEVKNDRGLFTVLLGDTVSSGRSSGCCTDGIEDEDIVLRCLDLSSVVNDYRKFPAFKEAAGE